VSASGGCFLRGMSPSLFGVVSDFHDPRRLLLDFDLPERPDYFHIWSTLRLLDLEPLWVRQDRTNKGVHVVLALRRASKPLESLALQAVLGSDIRREALNLFRVLRQPTGLGRSRWNVLYSYKLS